MATETKTITSSTLGFPPSAPWDNSSAEYLRYAAQSPVYLGSAESVVRLGDIRARQVVVDLACGTGVVTQQLLRTPFALTLKVVALDFSSEMLAAAQQSIKATNVEFHKEQAENLHLVVTKADRVLCNAAFWQLDCDSVLSAVRAILQPDGLVVFSVPGEDILRYRPADELRRENYVVWMLIDELMRRGFSTGETTNALRPPRRDLLKAIYHGGFRIRALEDVQCEVTADDYLRFAQIPIMGRRLGSSPTYDLYDVIEHVRAKVLPMNIAVPPVKWRIFVLERQ